MPATSQGPLTLRRLPWEPRAWTRRRERHLLERLRSQHGKRLLFIAGCARSGTSLLRKLMPCFTETAVAPREQRVAHFLELADAPDMNLVVKRTDRCHRDLPALPTCVDLVYCVRHPYDCLTSFHPHTYRQRAFHVTRHRWMREYESLLRLLDRQPARTVTFVRYEDLVHHPDGVQASIATAIGLRSRYEFSSNPFGVKIHAASVGKWRRNRVFAHFIAAFDRPWHARIGEFCERFGYGPPKLTSGRARHDLSGTTSA